MAVNNPVSVASLYPTFGGESQAMRVTSPRGGPYQSTYVAGKSYQGGRYQGASNTIGSSVGSSQVLGQPLGWWVILAALTVFVWWGAQKLGEDGDFANIRLTFTNALLISALAVIGLSFWKVLAAAFLGEGNPVRKLVMAA